MPNRHPQVSLPMDNVMFIACGAFAGLAHQDAKRGRSLGFGGAQKEHVISRDDYFAPLSGGLLADTRQFVKYGIMPELFGRFSQVVPFQPLSKEEMKSIFEIDVLERCCQEFAMEGIKLVIEPGVTEAIIDSAIQRQTGVRGLRAAISPALEQAAFDCFGNSKVQSVRIGIEEGKILAIKDTSNSQVIDSCEAIA